MTKPTERFAETVEPQSKGMSSGTTNCPVSVFASNRIHRFRGRYSCAATI